MARAAVPDQIPALPEGMTTWARSTKRLGSMFHAHALGFTACGRVYLHRHQSKAVTSVGDMQYYGVCPHCLSKVKG